MNDTPVPKIVVRHGSLIVHATKLVLHSCWGLYLLFPKEQHSVKAASPQVLNLHYLVVEDASQIKLKQSLVPRVFPKDTNANDDGWHLIFYIPSLLSQEASVWKMKGEQKVKSIALA
jgi:hypothetical protein